MTPAIDGTDGVEFDLVSADGRPGMSFEVDLGAAVGYWQPGLRETRVLPPDWRPTGVTSLVQSTPLGVLYDPAGHALMSWAADATVGEVYVSAGVSEERKSFRVVVQAKFRRDGRMKVRLSSAPSTLVDAVAELTRWMLDQSGVEAAPLPAVVSKPVYSTWYTFTQDLAAEAVLAEAQAAVETGCGAVFLDDGWQQLATGRGYQGCGDWVPDTDKFNDLAATVASIKALGAEVALWVAPLLLGSSSRAFAELGSHALIRSEALNCAVLDPRVPAVRKHVADLCCRLVHDYGVSILKVDFLEQAMLYSAPAPVEAGIDGEVDAGGKVSGPSPAGHDGDVGEAVNLMLVEVRTTLERDGYHDVALEFRQPYVSPALVRHGQILRANDCPADSVVNRTATVDSRLIAAGRVVHADPLMWGLSGGPEAVAQQMFAIWFAVPQISMRLTDLTERQRSTLTGLLTLWNGFADVTLRGRLQVWGAESGYVQVKATDADLGRSVIACYGTALVELGPEATATVLILNATSASRVVIETARPVVNAEIRGADTEQRVTVDSLTPGLHALSVPAFGSVVLRLDLTAPAAGNQVVR